MAKGSAQAKAHDAPQARGQAEKKGAQHRGLRTAAQPLRKPEACDPPQARGQAAKEGCEAPRGEHAA